MSPAEQQDKNQPQVLRGGAGNVDKIRDILFGSQMRDYESRFARLEETLIKETLDSICKATIFTKLDVIAAFNRIRIAEGHE